jgi:hypothetical protein
MIPTMMNGANRKSCNAYQDTAECDEFLFGDYDYENEWLGKKNEEGI